MEWSYRLAVCSPSGLSIGMATLTLRPTVIVAAACIVLAWATNHHVYAEDRAVRIVVIGDSLTAGYGVLAVDAFPAKLERALRTRGHIGGGRQCRREW